MCDIIKMMPPPVWNSSLAGNLYLFGKPCNSESEASTPERGLPKWWFPFPHGLQGRMSYLSLLVRGQDIRGATRDNEGEGSLARRSAPKQDSCMSLCQVYKGPTALTCTGLSFSASHLLMATKKAPQPSVLIQEVGSRSSHLSLELETTFSKSVLAKKTHLERCPRAPPVPGTWPAPHPHSETGSRSRNCF